MKRQVRNSRQRIRQCEGGEVRAITKRFIADSCHRIWQCEGGGFGRIPSYADDRVVLNYEFRAKSFAHNGRLSTKCRKQRENLATTGS